ncbi:hypothetical protein FGG08_002941 [Glutinoglossum americanum]|uniref:Glucose-methanol-choline oxidoreductase N-terminal domain-containing protein n=1 Tax=Glutinoglossum americanum TaxID=1670608 RepID=A0A9P8KYP9_9PEZI|nr:hypothetical protein FGG08_002941 [Glutinoglossum americanum]
MADCNGVLHEVDVIIAGGGAAGCVVAGRLARADPSLEILVVESGINTKNNPQIIHPAYFPSNLVPDTKTAFFYKGKPSEHIAGRAPIVPTGACLGGGSSINYMMYTRGQAIDYDSWDTEGWSAKDLIPLFRKTEKFHLDDPAIDKSVHGYDGDFNVSRGTFTDKAFQDDFIDSAASIGIKEAVDANNFVEGNAVGRWLMWIDPETGFRQDVPHRLIYPTLDAGNTKLQVLTESKVVRVLFDQSKRAVGIEHISNQASAEGGQPKVVRARKLVVVSAGALGSPQILQRSGIGNEQKLSPLGISTLSAVDGVGTNYQDHDLLVVPYRSKAKPEDTLDGLLSGRLSLKEALKQKTLNPSRNILGWNGIDNAAKLRPSPEEVKALGPTFEEHWNRDFRDQPPRPLALLAVLSSFAGDQSSVPPGQYFTTASYTAYPYSRGSIHITGPSVTDYPDFDSGILSQPVDVTKSVWGYKKQRELARRMKHYAGTLEAGRPKFRDGSKAGFEFVDAKQARGEWEDIEYDAEDDEAIAQFVRENISTTFHSMGTCAMKPLEEGGVVDKHLNVYGVSGLKVADLSICPKNVGSNTYSTALVIGEKAAVIIAEELGITIAEELRIKL